MDVEAKMRLELSKSVTLGMITPSFRRFISFRQPDGTVPIVLALPSDSMAYIRNQVEAKGGSANVVVRESTTQLAVFNLRVDRDRLTSDDHGEIVELQTVSEIGMLVDLLSANGGHVDVTLSMTNTVPAAAGHLVPVA